ncbi:MAG: hypothetical protein ACT4RN_00900 [Pseudonocardia sp.]
MHHARAVVEVNLLVVVVGIVALLTICALIGVLEGRAQRRAVEKLDRR